MIATEVEKPLRSASQRARLFSEAWVTNHFFCPGCGSSLTRTPNNTIALDFTCSECSQGFELKSKRGNFGGTVVNGAYGTLIKCIRAGDAPNLLLLSYSEKLDVKSVLAIPKRFFVEEIVVPRKPLGPHCRRAGWQGCNLNIAILPSAGKIECVKDFKAVDKCEIQNLWRETSFMDSLSPLGQGWMAVVMGLISKLKQREFSLDDLYRLEGELKQLYPKNANIRAKLRQQLQRLRDAGWIVFEGKGHYRLNNWREPA